MKAQELRIGNYVNINYTNEEFVEIGEDCDYIETVKTSVGTVTRITPDNEDYPIWAISDEDEITDFDSITPIPLTEEWLKNLGAMLFTNYVVYGRFQMHFSESEKNWLIYSRDKTGAYITRVKNLHEFQNFIFIMDGAEVIIH